MLELISLSKDELCNLSNDDLCERMEAVLIKILCESYTDPSAINDFPRQSIKDFFKTKKIQSLSQENQRKALKKCFEYLAFHEYIQRVGGWMNQAVYNSNYDENYSWLSPRTQSIACAISHITITGSASAFERMMDLLHIIETGETLSEGKKKSKSKFKKFRLWLLKPQNKFVFFAPNLLHIHEFRSRLRTAEVHESSSLPNKLLQLQKPSHDETNEPLRLVNILMAMWSPLLTLLDERIPESTAGSGSGLEWLVAIKNKDISTIQAELDRLDANLK